MVKQKQESAEKVRKVTRIEAANRVVGTVNGKTTLSRLAEQADMLFVEGGGDADLKIAVRHVKRTGQAWQVARLGLWLICRRRPS